MSWVAFFSQTGSEIYQVSKLLGRFPDRIVCNKPLTDIAKINPELVKEHPNQWLFVPKKPSVQDYTTALDKCKVATLHGWLRIVPGEVCEYYEIYNGHPGDIETYPQLKGFNPQVKAFEQKLPSSGSVIHRVTAGVDEGPIIASEKVIIEGLTLNEVYKTLHSNSVNLWYNFLQAYFK